MIIDKHKAIFVHIPKNAGTSIEEYFGNESVRIQPSKHADIYEIKWKFRNSYNDYRKFTIIRNPYDKMVSWYFYLRKMLGKHHRVLEFGEWVKDPSKFWHADDPISFLKPQCEWVDDTVEIIKFENLNKELNNFFDKEIKLPIINKSKHNHYSEYYNKKSLDIIYNRYEEDFKKYNYEKL